MLRKISLYSKILLPALLFTIVSAMESSDCVSTSDEYNSNLYTKLVFEEGVTFEAHEIVKIAMTVMDKAESVDPIVPKYETYEEQIEAKFCELLDSFVEKASRHYGVPPELMKFILWNFERLGINAIIAMPSNVKFPGFCDDGIEGLYCSEFLLDQSIDSYCFKKSIVPRALAVKLLEKLQKERLIEKKRGEFIYKLSSLATTSLFFWNEIMNTVMEKQKNESGSLKLVNETFDKYILPDTIQVSEPSFRGWLGLASHIEVKDNRPDIKAWWLNIGDRLIGLKNNPERWDLYVTDHGFNQDIIDGTEMSLISYDFDAQLYLLAAYIFVTLYDISSEKMQEHLQYRYCLLYDKNAVYNEQRNEVLLSLFLLGCTAMDYDPKKDFLDGEDVSKMRIRYYSYKRELKNTGASEINLFSLLTNEEKLMSSKLSQEQKKVGLQYFFRTIQSMKTKIEEYRKMLSPNRYYFFMQLDRIFAFEDADRYKKFLQLKDASKKLGDGDPAHIFQPIHTFGAIDKGAAYPELAETIERYFSSTDSLPSTDLAKIMRDILRGEPIDDENLYFLPNLVAAWFVSEVGRNHLSLLSGLVLLDLIESDVVHRDSHGNNLYTWKHTLVHPSASRNQDKMMDMYGESVGVKNIDGIHPMSHKGSVNHCREDFMVNGEKLRPVRQKEGHLFIHWLSEKLKSAGEHVSLSRDYLSEPKRGKKGKRGRPGTKEYDEINYLLGVEEVSTISSGKERLRKKWEKLQQIKGALLDRTQALDCLLSIN